MTLTISQIEEFKTKGFIRLENVFSRTNAFNVQDFIWDKLKAYKIFKSDKNSWSQDMVHIREDFGGKIFNKCVTNALICAIEQIEGKNRQKEDIVNSLWGWWPINFFYGADYPWTIPTEGWHWDGQTINHSISSHEMGLLLICMFSDVKPKGGATLLAQGSHQLVIRFLNEFPNGLSHKKALDKCTKSSHWLKLLTGINDSLDYRNSSPKEQKEAEFRINKLMNEETIEHGINLKVVESIGNAGDIYICHPFLYHAASFNHSSSPRFMCNKIIPLKEPLKFKRVDYKDYSLLELIVKESLKESCPNE